MSAILIKPTEFGDNVEFFRLGFLSIDRDELQITIVIKGYATQAAFESGAKPKMTKGYTLQGEWLVPYLSSLENNPLTVSELFELFYNMTVNQDPYFEGAERA